MVNYMFPSYASHMPANGCCSFFSFWKQRCHNQVKFHHWNYLEYIISRLLNPIQNRIFQQFDMATNENEADDQTFRVSPKDARLLIGDRFRLENLPLTRLFLAKNGYFPCVVKYELSKTNSFFHVPTVLKYFEKTFGHDSSTDICIKRLNRRHKLYFTK